MNHAAPTPDAAARAQDTVDPDRLNTAIATLAALGGRADGGVARETLTPLDLDARRLLIARALALGCEVTVDPCANLFFRRAGSRPDLPPVLTGSHIDTQPVGGALDGAYGVVAALEALQALNDAGIVTKRPIEAVVWTNEEGSRFSPGAMGSSAYAQPERLAQYRNARDAQGVVFGDALDATLAALTALPGVSTRELGTLGASVDSCVELHIEQGPVLEHAATPLGVVTGIQGVRWFSVTVEGRAAHAGTTPVETRRDAMKAAQRLAGQLYAAADDLAGRGLRVTLGRWRVAPNSINTIAGEVEFTLDTRAVDEDVLERFEAAVVAATTALDGEDGYRVRVEPLFARGTTRFPDAMVEAVERGCARASSRAHERAPLRLTSGAFHDAMYLADLCPTAMIFVPSRDGISHNPAEYTEPRQLGLGAQALAHVVTELANR
ncbi:Zn-dependent hydrolase [Burkholderia sp. WAC0059]|uniref:M20 family metallo-hydrolase n=1 Tax=Burkholderia sp. WAC0059 TaxID=2066022 RepID=UPI000C7F2BB3|nr:M20 family metallo-hydrolase [Burkholderia sp. WAC0059]PLZ00867.1 Zn-dependent hydrolase [Burkholderia sp. WAC0059]